MGWMDGEGLVHAMRAKRDKTKKKKKKESKIKEREKPKITER